MKLKIRTKKYHCVLTKCRGMIMLSFKVFQPIIDGCTSRLTSALSHASTSPIRKQTMFSLSFIFNGIDIVILIKETKLSS